MSRRRAMARTAAGLAVALGMAGLAQAGAAAPGHGEHHGHRGDDGRHGRPGAVYTQSNAAGANAVLAFRRGPGGALAPAGSFPTGGAGSGDGLGSQGAVTLDRDRLLVVNAGSDEVSSLRLREGRPHLVDVAPAGGRRPVSVTVHGDLVYVVNDGSSDVSGLRISAGGELTPIPGSTRPLSTAASAPAQVQFSPDGDLLVVTEKATDRITAFPVLPDGTLADPVVTASSGATPFGFDFDRRGRIFVSEAFGGAPDASALSSYTTSGSGSVGLVSGSVATFQTAACWVDVTRSGRFAYVTNTGSDSITGYAIGRDGAVRRLDADGVTARTGDTPIDVALTRGSRRLYALNASDDSISGYRVRADGSLAPLGTTAGLPPATVGLAAR